MLSEFVSSKQLDRMAVAVVGETEAGLGKQKINFSLSSAVLFTKIYFDWRAISTININYLQREIMR